MYTVCISISCNDGFLGDTGKFCLEFPNAAQFKTREQAVKAIKHHNKTKTLQEFTSFKVVESYGLESQVTVVSFTVIYKQVLVIAQ